MTLLKEGLSFFIVILIVFIACSEITRHLPGDPIETILQDSASKVSSEELKKELGLDKNGFEFIRYKIDSLIRFDFGKSLISRKNVLDLIQTRLKNTAHIVFLSFILGTLFGLLIGIRSASKPLGTCWKLSSIYSALIASLPTPWFAFLILLTFSIWVPLFPLSQDWVLPTLCLSLIQAAFFSRLVRDRVRDSLTKGAAQAARARGLSEKTVLLKYALIPVSGILLGYLGNTLGVLLGGTFITETIFQWPGMGLLLVESIKQRDYTVVEGTLFFAASFAWIGNRLGLYLQKNLTGRMTE